MEKNKKKKGKWIKKRHTVARNIAYALLAPYAKLKYGITVHKFREKQKRAYLILYNHQTAFDQFFVGMAFRGPVYYLASEDIFSNGFLSKVIRFLVEPIPIKKQTMDIKAIKSCLQVVREGGTIAIAPEGNRTFSGKTEYMSPSIAMLARKLGLPILLYRIEGGYGVHPRWSDVVRRGRMRSYVARVIEPEEYAGLTNEELFEIIREGLFRNEANADDRFVHSKRAEYIERALYVCPFCGLSSFESHGASFRCLTCHREVEYGERTELRGVGFDLPFRFAEGWYAYQKKFVSEYELTADLTHPLYTDAVRFSEVIIGRRKECLCKQAELSLWGDRLTVKGQELSLTLPYEEISVIAVLGKNKLNIYHADKVYQVKGSKRFNALKYVNLFYRYKNIESEDGNGKFLGL